MYPEWREDTGIKEPGERTALLRKAFFCHEDLRHKGFTNITRLIFNTLCNLPDCVLVALLIS